jgi:hypothetical protein
MVLIGLLITGSYSAQAFTSADADTMINAFNNAYYNTFGNGLANYLNTQTGGISYFWTQAEMIETLEDAYDRTGSTTYSNQITALLNGFTSDNGTNWFSIQYNDDVCWGCLAYLRGYQITGNTTFSTIAKSNYDMMYARAWDTVAGGLWWDVPKGGKNIANNGPAVILAYMIYQIFNDSSYLTKAQNIYNWEKTNLYDPTSGATWASVSSGGVVNYANSVATQGLFVGDADLLNDTTNAALAAEYAMNVVCNGGGIMQYQDEDGLGIRWIAKYVINRGLQSTYLPWLQYNADVIVASRRPADSLCWEVWASPTGTTNNLSSWECFVSVLALQVVPPSIPYAWDANEHGAANTYPFTPNWSIATNGDLILGQVPTSSSGNFGLEANGRSVNSLTAGGSLTINSISNLSGGITTSTNYVTCGNGGGAGSNTVYTLTGSTNGYNLTNITVYGGWQDSTRDQQAFAIYYSTVSAPTNFILLTSVNYNPSLVANTPSATRVTIAPVTAGSVLAANVAALMFDFSSSISNGISNGYCGYAQIAVYGTPTVGPLPVTVSNFSFENDPANTIVPTSWTSFNDANYSGVISSEYPNPLPAPADGTKYFALNEGPSEPPTGGIYQDVGPLQPDTLYTLTVALGRRSDFTPGSGLGSPGIISLLNGTNNAGTLLATTSGIANTPGTWQNYNVTYGTGPSVNGNLVILLSVAGASTYQANFDNVRLAAIPIPVPTDTVNNFSFEAQTVARGNVWVTTPTGPGGWTGFHTGTNDSWDIGLGRPGNEYSPANPLATPADGDNYLWLNDYNGNGTQVTGIYQDVGPLLANTTYTLTVVIGSRGDRINSPGHISLVNGADNTGTVLASVSGIPAIQNTWQNYTVSYTTGASVSGDLIIMLSILDAGTIQADFDNVRLAVTPSLAPTLAVPYISQGNLIMTGGGGTPNGGYTLLATTNLMPPINWTTNRSGSLDGSGTFSNAIPINASQSATFLRLRMP